MLYRITYYAKPDSTQPVGEWLDSLSIEHQAVVMAKIQALEENGLVLLGTRMLSAIKGGDKDFYELRGGVQSCIVLQQKPECLCVAPRFPEEAAEREG